MYGAGPVGAATITLSESADVALPNLNGHPVLLRLGPVSARTVDADTIVFHGTGASGRILLADLSATISVSTEEDADPAAAVYSMLTLSAALLLGRLGAALVHAGGIVDPTGGAWLFAGDTHAGKTTTCVSLADAGWRFLADDQVVLREVEGAIVSEGWPRLAHLDAGYDRREITDQRIAADVGERWSRHAANGTVRTAAVHAVVLPAVEAERRTSVRRVSPADALSVIVRQSPWLLADRVVAPRVLALLQATSLRPAYALTLGRDSYGNGALLGALLGALGNVQGVCSGAVQQDACSIGPPA